MSDVIEIMARALREADQTDLWGESYEQNARILRLALDKAGLAIVPVEPTEAMHDAARDWSALKYGKPIGTDASHGCWQAMITASNP